MVEVIARLNREKGPEDIVLKFPQKWDELTQRQLLYIAKRWADWQAAARLRGRHFSERCLLLLELCGLESKKDKRRLCKHLEFVDENTDHNPLDLVQFVFDGTNLKKNLLPRLRAGLTPQVRVRFTPWPKVKVTRYYYGPADEMKDCSVDEFSFVFGLYSLYHQTRQEKYLDALVAALYRPKNKSFDEDGHLRIPFVNKTIAQRVKRISRLDFKYKMAVLLFFEGVLEHLRNKYPMIFRRAKTGVANGGTFYDTIMELSGAAFGDFDKTKQQDLYVVLDYLKLLMKKQEKKKK